MTTARKQTRRSKAENGEHRVIKEKFMDLKENTMDKVEKNDFLFIILTSCYIV